MMKRVRSRLAAILLVALAALFFVAPAGVTGEPVSRPAADSIQMRGVWVTTVYNLDWPS